MAQAVAQRLSLPFEWLSDRLPTIAAWGLGFVPVTVLAFQGGGYDAVVRSQVGIAVWWILALGCLVGAITPAFPSRPALIAAALLGALGVWSWVGILTSESPERTLSEVARVATYFGVLLLGLFTLDRRRAPAALLGIASGIVLVAGLAVMSRLQPGLFPANETGAYLDIARHRLNWPLNYWNGLAALCALGVPVVLTLAAGHRSVAIRALAAAALPVLALCIGLTLSRGGIVATVVGLVVLLCATSERPRALASLAVGGVASGILLAAAAQRGLVHEDLRSNAALQQGDELTWVTIVVSLGAGLVQAGLAFLEPLPRASAVTWRPSSKQLRAGAVVAVGLAVVTLVAVDAPGRVADGWREFKSPAVERDIADDNDASRLGSLSSNGRYQLWNLALDAMGSHPILGTGAGTYEFTWLRETPIGKTVRDAHSFYLETGAETGLVGLALALALVCSLLSPFAGLRRTAREVRAITAAALAAIAAFAFSAAVDWVWELPAIAVTAMLLAAVGFTAQREPGRKRHARREISFAVALTALVVIGVLAIVLASASSVNESRASVRAGSLTKALRHAEDAHAVLAAGVTPLLQSAMVREQSGDVRGAAVDARSAARLEPDNWRTWLVLSRLEARLGRPNAAVRAFRRARTLNPMHPIFQR
jgi:O-antigen ligase